MLNNDAALVPDAIQTLLAASAPARSVGLRTLSQFAWEEGDLIKRGCREKCDVCEWHTDPDAGIRVTVLPMPTPQRRHATNVRCSGSSLCTNPGLPEFR